MDVAKEARSMVSEVLVQEELESLKAALVEPYTDEDLARAVEWLEDIRTQEVLLELALRGVVEIIPSEPLRFGLTEMGKTLCGSSNFPEALASLWEGGNEGPEANSDPQ